MTLKCLSDGVPTPTLSWYKPEGSINSVRARENKVQVPPRGDQDFGNYKCIAANGLVPSDEKLIKINQISKLKKLVYFDERKTIYKVNILFCLYSLSYIYIYIYIYIYNCRQYCFGLLGLISAVLMLGWR